MTTGWCCLASTMDGTPRTEDGADGEGWEDELFFIEGPSSSDDELEFDPGDQKHHRKQTTARSGESSPPLLLAYSITSGQKQRDGSWSPAPSFDAQAEEEEGEEEEEAIEEWMILGGGEQSGDSSIHINLSYWNSSEDDSLDEDQSGNSEDESWVVSEKDKCDAARLLPVRYFLPGRSQICSLCNRPGHPGSSCYYHKKSPTCVLCGIRGHVCRDCPSRPCSSCGLPSHGLRPCERPPVWNQHCQRCGMTGHLLDVCPDTWRQYHLTVSLEFPLRPQKQKCRRSRACCYNCSRRGHFGHECTKRRMISGTSPSVPYVCHYDTIKEETGNQTRTQNIDKELLNTASAPDLQPLEPTKEGNTGSHTAKEGSRAKLEIWSLAGRRKTWPERRRERREVKRLRREAQARRNGTVSERFRGSYDDEDFTADSFRSSLQGHWQSTVSPQKKRSGEEGGRRTRKKERWKKRGGAKQRDLICDTDIGTEHFLSSKQRVRQRRR